MFAGHRTTTGPVPPLLVIVAGVVVYLLVRKKDGQKVTDALNEPGSKIVNTRDVSTGESGSSKQKLRKNRRITQKNGASP